MSERKVVPLDELVEAVAEILNDEDVWWHAEIAAQEVIQLVTDSVLAAPDAHFPGRFRYGVAIRHDGQEVRYRHDPAAIINDDQYRFEVFPAECGCYPPDTDDREYTCEHGARWTRRFGEPYGMPEK